jgi:K+-transporting ATPase KdpF subunit
VDSEHVALGAGGVCLPVRLYIRLREDMKGHCMGVLTGITAVVTLLLLVYLFAALVRPEWF